MLYIVIACADSGTHCVRCCPRRVPQGRGTYSNTAVVRCQSATASPQWQPPSQNPPHVYLEAYSNMLHSSTDRFDFTSIPETLEFCGTGFPIFYHSTLKRIESYIRITRYNSYPTCTVVLQYSRSWMATHRPTASPPEISRLEYVDRKSERSVLLTSCCKYGLCHHIYVA